MIEYLRLGMFIIVTLREPISSEYPCYYFRCYDGEWQPLLGDDLDREKAKETVLSMLPVGARPFVKWEKDPW